MTPSAIWGLAVPIPATDVTARTDGIISTTAMAESLTEAGGVPDAESGTITTTLNGAVSTETSVPSARTLTITDAAGRKASWVYDQAGRVVMETTPGAPPVAVAYDTNGRPTSETVGTGSAARTTRIAYDAVTGHTTITRPDGTTSTVLADANGNLTAGTTPDGGTVLEGYDADGRLTALQPAGGLGFTLGYSPAGRPTLFLPPAVGSDTTAETTTYDADGNRPRSPDSGPARSR